MCVATRHLLLVVSSLLGCSGAKPEEPKPATSTPTTETKPGGSMSFRVHARWTYGPCPDGSGRSCHQEVYVRSDGTAQSLVWPEPDKTGKEPPPKSAETKISEASWKRIVAILESPAFKKGMHDGFECRRSWDALFQLETSDGTQEVTACDSGPAKEIRDLLDELRWLAGQP